MDVGPTARCRLGRTNSTPRRCHLATTIRTGFANHSNRTPSTLARSYSKANAGIDARPADRRSSPIRPEPPRRRRHVDRRVPGADDDDLAADLAILERFWCVCAMKSSDSQTPAGLPPRSPARPSGPGRSRGRRRRTRRGARELVGRDPVIEPDVDPDRADPLDLGQGEFGRDLVSGDPIVSSPPGTPRASKTTTSWPSLPKFVGTAQAGGAGADDADPLPGRRAGLEEAFAPARAASQASRWRRPIGMGPPKSGRRTPLRRAPRSGRPGRNSRRRCWLRGSSGPRRSHRGGGSGG